MEAGLIETTLLRRGENTRTMRKPMIEVHKREEQLQTDVLGVLSHSVGRGKKGFLSLIKGRGLVTSYLDPPD